jgi:REP element-mobilizing transposase RayT
MGNPSPLEYDAFYHIYSRGNNKEDIFYEERNYNFFIERYTKYIEPVAETLAYCLLKNHFHFLVKIRSENDVSKIPSKQFSHLLNSYSKAINKAYGRTGGLFQHPFGRKLILDNDQLFVTVAYIHQNPIKYHFVKNKGDWKWSSFYEAYTNRLEIIKQASLEMIFGKLENYLSIEYPLADLKDVADFD